MVEIAAKTLQCADQIGSSIYNMKVENLVSPLPEKKRTLSIEHLIEVGETQTEAE